MVVPKGKGFRAYNCTESETTQGRTVFESRVLGLTGQLSTELCISGHPLATGLPRYTISAYAHVPDPCEPCSHMK
jgi:hypothetical protein